MVLKIFIVVYVVGWLSFIYSAVTAKYENERIRQPEETFDRYPFGLKTETRSAKFSSTLSTTPETVALKKSA